MHRHRADHSYVVSQLQRLSAATLLPLTNNDSCLLQYAGVEVSKGHDLYYSHSALISFTSSAGDVPALRVVTNKLTGSSPTVAVTTVRNGSTDQLFGPIPAEMTQIPVTYPDSIQVVVNKVPAACASGAACRFSHSAGLTPSVTSVTPVDALKPDVGTTQVSL